MALIFALMLALFAVGMPVAWAMAASAAVFMAFVSGVPLQGLAQRMVGGIDSFPLLAMPFFILAGNLMNTGGITVRLVTLAKALVGHITGGLAHTVVVVNMIMAGMSGSGVADAAGSGVVLIPTMKRVGYALPFSAAIVGAAGTIGPMGRLAGGQLACDAHHVPGDAGAHRLPRRGLGTAFITMCCGARGLQAPLDRRAGGRGDDAHVGATVDGRADREAT